MGMVRGNSVVFFYYLKTHTVLTKYLGNYDKFGTVDLISIVIAILKTLKISHFVQWIKYL